MEPMLRIAGLNVAYRAHHRPPVSILRNAELTLNEGEAVGIYGESGGGKTTLTRAIMRLLPAHGQVDGQIVYRGEDLLHLPAERMRRLRGASIGLIPQEPSVALNPVMRIQSQVAEVIHTHCPLDWKRAQDAARSRLENFFGPNADRIARSYPHQLSGGERQRVVIAQAVCCSPALLIADEPASALDTITQYEVLTLLRQLRNQASMALLYVSHSRAALNFVADRCLELRDGRFVR
ncbi:MAG: ATP-binding cassette domain-containing protein [Bryobacteraceae bacterium]